MTRGFRTILAAQFFSSLADNALFVVAVELLLATHTPEWQRTALVPVFTVFYVLLAPWVGAFADSRPKGQVMFISNAVKVLGSVLMLAGGHPLLAYAIVGLGAATYSPAKYGILTELIPHGQLVQANGWMEGLTVASIILGVVLGGQLVGPHLSGWQHAIPGLGFWLPTAPMAAIAVVTAIYALAAIFNLYIPRTNARLRRLPRRAMWLLLPDFRRCNRRLWHDRLGQISLATTTLIWGTSGNMRYIVLAWAVVALGYATTDGATLVGVVAIGMALGAAAASIQVRLDRALRVLPLGMLLGLVVVAMVWVRTPWLAAALLVALGILGGYMVVPMNALLQHRGHHLVGAGRSIAVQNFNEQGCIFLLGALYTVTSWMGLSTLGAVALFGAIMILGSAGILAWARFNRVRYASAMVLDLKHD